MINQEYSSISEILEGKFTGQKVKVHGWLQGRRSGGGILFLVIRDGSGILQCTIRKENLSESKFKNIEKIPIESTLNVKGMVKQDERSPGGFEVAILEVEVLHVGFEDYPIAKKYHGPEFLLDYRYLYLRNEKMQAVMRIRAALLRAAREWFENNDYLEVQMPVLITAACEGGSTLFEVKYFDQKAYLTQSWQLYAEATIASLGKIYTIAPSFRAEKSRTRRHLTEYWHIEAEAPWCELKDILRVQEEFLTFICHKIGTEKEVELKVHGRDPEDLLKVKPPIDKITYDVALEKLRNVDVDLRWGEDLNWEQEKILADMFDKPFFVTHYPKTAKAFYHKPDPTNSNVTLSADLLAPEGYGEITGGGQRIDDLNQLLERINDEKLDPQEYKWYIDLRRYGSVPHSGFGMGLERVIMWICKLTHIRDAIAFPRLINRVYP
jgi:asparaginyl-tRNA synthetase